MSVVRLRRPVVWREGPQPQRERASCHLVWSSTSASPSTATEAQRGLPFEHGLSQSIVGQTRVTELSQADCWGRKEANVTSDHPPTSQQQLTSANRG